MEGDRERGRRAANRVSVQNSHEVTVTSHRQCWTYRSWGGQCKVLSVAVLVTAEVTFS